MADDIKELSAPPKTLKLQSPKGIEALNTSLGGVQGVDYSRMAKEIKTPEQVASAEGELYKQMEPQRLRLSEMESEKARVDAVNKAAVAESESTKVYSAESERKRMYDENPYPKLNPTKENIQSLATLFSLIGVVGVGLGGRGKMSAMNSLNAMTGLMKGWQQGRADLFKKDLQEFEKNMTSIKSILDAADKEADRIYKLIPIDRAKAETEMAALTASLGGQILTQKTNIQGLEQGIALIKDLKKTNDDAWERAFKERKEALDIRKVDVQEKRIDKQTEIAEKRSEDQMSRLLLTLRASDDRLDKRLASEGKKRTNEDRKNDRESMVMTQGVRSIENLQRQLRDPDVRSGLTSKLAPLLQKINSLSNTEDFESAINRELTGNDKTTLFLKDALLETYAIERAAKGGQRLTVQDMKMVGPVLDPTNYKPETYNALLEQRRNVLYNNLQDMGLTIPEIQERAKQRAYVPYGGDTSVSAGDISTKAKESFGSYEPNKYEYRLNPETGKVQRKQKGQ